MAVKIGTSDVFAIYVGTTPVKAVYVGTTKIWHAYTCRSAWFNGYYVGDDDEGYPRYQYYIQYRDCSNVQSLFNVTISSGVVNLNILCDGDTPLPTFSTLSTWGFN